MSKQLSCTLQNPVPIRNDPRFQELAAETPSLFNQDKDRSNWNCRIFRMRWNSLASKGCSASRRANMKYPG